MPASRHLQELVAEAATAIGRSADDVRPFLKTLEENWFDTVESVRTICAKDLQDLGIPLRFARELVTLAQGPGSGSGTTLPTLPPPPPVPAVPAVPAPAAGGSGRGPLAPPVPTPQTVPARTVPPRTSVASTVPPPQRGQQVPVPPQQPSRSSGKGGRGDWTDWRGQRNDRNDRNERSERNERNERTEWEREKGKGSKGKHSEAKGGKGSTLDSNQWNSYSQSRPKGKGRGEEDWNGKGKRGRQGLSCFSCGGEHYQRDCPVSAKGQGKTHAQQHGSALHTHKIFLDIEDPDPKFNLNGRLIGQNHQNVKHIQEITGATVELAGQGSGGSSPDEQLHVLLQSQDAQTLEEAIRVTNDLIDTVLDQYAAWQGGTGDQSKGTGKNAKRRGNMARRGKHQNHEEPHAKRAKGHWA